MMSNTEMAHFYFYFFKIDVIFVEFRILGTQSN
jgi:hypothetical protein